MPQKKSIALNFFLILFFIFRLFPYVSTGFVILVNNTIVSYATQSLINIPSFYNSLQIAINADPTLGPKQIDLVQPNIEPVVMPSNLFHLTLTKRLSVNDAYTLGTLVSNFINQYAIRKQNHQLKYEFTI